MKSVKRKKYSKNKAMIISIPRAGRTWLKALLSYYISKAYNLPNNVVVDITKFHKMKPKIPALGASHDKYATGTFHKGMTPYKVQPSLTFSKDKSMYRDTKIIFLVRDPRDVLVSNYFDEYHRARDMKKVISMTDHVQASGRLLRIIQFYNVWYETRKQPKDFMLLRYENMRRKTRKNFQRVVEFIGLKISEFSFTHAIKNTQFDLMQKREKAGYYKNSALRPTNKHDVRTFKVRKGKVGGFTEYFTKEDVAYATNLINEHLNPVFGYCEV